MFLSQLYVLPPWWNSVNTLLLLPVHVARFCRYLGGGGWPCLPLSGWARPQWGYCDLTLYMGLVTHRGGVSRCRVKPYSVLPRGRLHCLQAMQPLTGACGPGLTAQSVQSSWGLQCFKCIHPDVPRPCMRVLFLSWPTHSRPTFIEGARFFSRATLIIRLGAWSSALSSLQLEMIRVPSNASKEALTFTFSY